MSQYTPFDNPRVNAIREEIRAHREAKYKAMMPEAKQILEIVESTYTTRMSEERRLNIIECKLNQMHRATPIKSGELIELFGMYSLKTVRKQLQWMVGRYDECK